MKTEKIKIDSEYIKLQDLLKLGGAAGNRRKDR